MAGLKFRVLLDSSDKNEVFRDILIGDGETFETFYKSVLKAYHFSEDQMASFYVSNSAWDKGHEISLFDMTFGDESDAPTVMSEVMIREFIEAPDQKFILVHDFMRMWIFLIELIDYQQQTPETPQVLLEVGNAPDELSKSIEGEDLTFETESSEFPEEEEDKDEFDFNEFEDGYDEYDF